MLHHNIRTVEVMLIQSNVSCHQFGSINAHYAWNTVLHTVIINPTEFITILRHPCRLRLNNTFLKKYTRTYCKIKKTKTNP